MASCKSVVVVCPNARRQTVKVGPTTTILQILDEVCTKHGLSSQEFAVKHQRKILDETLPVRYSGLSNNAHLELVTQTKTSKAGIQCTVGLQLTSGERLVKDFPPTHSLWDVVCHWNSLEGSSHFGKLLGEAGQVVVCVYMTQKITGELPLKKATLHNLGLTGKRAIIRLLHETPVEQRVGEVEIQTPMDSLEKATALVPTPVDMQQPVTIATQTTSQAPSPSTATDMPQPVTIATQITSQAPSPSPETDMPQLECHDSRMDTTGNMPHPEARAAPDTANERIASAMQSAAIDSRQRPLDPGTVSPERAAKEPKRSRITGPNPLFPDFKFPDKPSTQDQRTDLVVTEERKQFLSTPCDRVPLVFSENDRSLSSTTDQGELPDSFFNVTVDDLRKMLQDLHSDRTKGENSPLMTKSMREARKLSESFKYEKIVIRVKFPDRLTLQGFFRPHEKVSALTQFVGSHLASPSTPFYLYTTPPKTILQNQDDTLYEADLCPASLVYFGSNGEQEPYLAGRHLEGLVTRLDAEQAVLQSRVQPPQTSTSQTSVANGNDGAVTSQSRDNSAGPQPSVYRPPGPSSGSSKATTPKWFKGTGK